MYYSAGMAEKKKLVITMYYTSSPNTVLAALSGMLSLLILVLNTLFPQVEHEKEIPTLVRTTNPIVRKIIFCCKDSGGGGGSINQEEGQSHDVENPVAGL